MILPTKHLEVDRSLLAVGANLLESLRSPRTVTSLWEELRKSGQNLGFERFALALAFLYAIGSIEFLEDRLKRTRS